MFEAETDPGAAEDVFHPHYVTSRTLRTQCPAVLNFVLILSLFLDIGILFTKGFFSSNLWLRVPEI